MKKDHVKCPSCNGTGAKECGRSAAYNRAISYGAPSSYECECCYGTGEIHKDTNPDWWKKSDNETGGR